MLIQPTYLSRLSAHWHLCYYIPHLRTTDLLSKQIINFKNGHRDTLSNWCYWAGNELEKQNIKFNFIIRALSSGEIQAQESGSLHELGVFLSEYLEVPYTPTIIYKTRLTQKLAFLKTKEDRIQEVKDVFRISGDCPDLTGKRILLIDDVCTGKVTSSEIVNAIKAKYPFCIIYLFTLAQTQRADNANCNIEVSYFAK